MEKRQANNVLVALWALVLVIAVCTGVMWTRLGEMMTWQIESAKADQVRNAIAKKALDKPLNVNSTCKSRFEVTPVPIN